MRETQEFVSVGKVYLKGGQVGVTIHRVTAPGILDPKPVYVRASKLKGVFAGARFTIDIEQKDSGDPDDFQFYPTSFAYVGRWDDEEQSRRWKTKEEVFEELESTERLRKKDRQWSAIQESLAPIRDLYVDSTRAQRRAIEILILDYLREPRG